MKKITAAFLLLLAAGLVSCSVLSPAEPEPPQVLYVDPLPQEELSLDGTITLYFDQPMDQGSIQLTSSHSFDYALRWQDDKVLEIVPEQLERAMTYVVDITGQSAEGLPLPVPTTFEVNTIGLLRVTETVPADSSYDIGIFSPITVFFNRPVVPLTLLDDADNLPQPLTFEPDIPGEGEWINTSIYVWRPDSRLRGGQRYLVSVDALTSADGAEMLEDWDFSFETQAPTVRRTIPTADTTAVTPQQQISMQFTQPMDPQSVEAAFSLTGRPTGQASSTGDELSGSFEWAEDLTGFAFTPDSPLDLATTYTATLTTQAGASDGSTDLREDYTWEFRTVAYPEIVATLPESGETGVSPLLYAVQIGVSAPLDADTLEDRLSISPTPPGEVTVFISNRRGDSDITLRAILNDNTEYTVTLQPGVSDPYGNTLDESFSFSFTTGEYPPQFLLSPDEWISVLDTRQGTDLLAFVRNIDKMFYQLYQLEETALADIPSGYTLRDYRPDSDALVREWTVDTSEIRENTGYNWRIPLDLSDGNQPSPGVYIFSARSSETGLPARRLLVLANANIVTKHSHTQALAWLTDLQTERPLSGVPVNFYLEDGEPLGTARTDDTGLALLDYSTPLDTFDDLIVVAESEGVYGVIYTAWGAGTGQYVPRLQEAYAIYPYTDRPIYRPGHEIYFKAIIRERVDAGYRLPEERMATVLIFNPAYDVVFEGEYPVSADGFIEGSYQLDSEAITGRYSIEVRLPRGDDDSDSERIVFQVAEYVRPEFRVTASPSEPEVLENDEVAVNTEGTYFFGGPVQQGTVNWSVFAQPYYFRPDIEDNRYSFIDFDRNAPIGADSIPGFGSQIIQDSGTMDATGTITLDIPTELAEFSSSQRFTIEVEVTDGSNQFVTESTSVVVHKGDAYVGVRPQRYIVTTGQPSSIELVAVSRDSELLPEQTVEVQVVQLVTYSVRELSPQGYTYWNNSIEELPVLQTAATTGPDGTASLTFTPPEAGSYKIIATITDVEGRSQRSTAYLWSSGGTRFVSWGQPNSRNITLVPDQDEYQPGDTASILIPVPYTGDDIRALITVERNDILRYEIVEIDSNSFVYELPIGPEYAPNVYFSVLLLKGADTSTVLPDWHTGRIALNVDTSSYELALDVTTDVPAASPGESVTYQVQVRDANGSPVEADVSFALVDLATLQLAPQNTVPLMDYFYRSIPLGVWSSLSLVYLREPIAPELFDQAKGGSGGIGDSFFDLRRDFRDTAYWNASVQTDENGIAEVTVTLPDNLTTWNMDVRAITPEGLVGQTTHELLSTERLLIRPITPRFFVAGDELTLAALAYNNSGQPLDVVISMEGTGYTLENGETHYNMIIPSGGVVRAEWPVTIDSNSGWVDLVFTVDGGELVDSTKPPVGDPNHDQMLPVYEYVTPETTGTSGQLADAGTRTESVLLPPGAPITRASVDVTLDYSLAASMTQSLTYLEDFPHQSTEQTVSRFMANAYTLGVLENFGLSQPELEANLEAEVNAALQRLYTQQHADGGWGWFVSDPSSSLVTAYVVQGMLAARDAGYPVEDEVFDRGVKYLAGSLRGADTRWERARLAYTLYILARAGRPDPGRTATLYERRADLPLWSTALLAQTLWGLNPDDPRLETLRAELMAEASIDATGTHWAESDPDTINWTTDTRTTAIVLDTFVRIWPDSDLNPHAVRWLMNARQHDRWETTQETSWALIALSNWMSATGELSPDYDWRVSVNQNLHAEGEASPEMALESDTITIPLDAPADRISTFGITRGNGEGTLYYTTRLNTELAIQDIEPVSRGFSVTRRYLNEAGETITAGLANETIHVELTVIVRDDQNYVYIEDPFPAGASGIDPALLTESATNRPTFTSENRFYSWGWWYFSQIQIRDEKAVLYAEHLPAGTYVFTYQLRLGVPGNYQVMPATATNFYFPDVYGRTAGTRFVIGPAE